MKVGSWDVAEVRVGKDTGVLVGVGSPRESGGEVEGQRW